MGLHAIDGLNQLGPAVRRGIGEDDNAKTITLAPKDVGAVRRVGSDRFQERTFKSVLGNPVSFHAGLCMTAHGNVPKPLHVSIKMRHGFRRSNAR